MPWGAVIGAVGAIAGSAINSSAAGANAQAAQNIANQDLGYTAPYSMNTSLGYTNFYNNGSGNNIANMQLSPGYQGVENGLLGGAGNFLNATNQLGETGGVSPFLANSYAQYQNSLPNTAGLGFGNLYNQAYGNQGTANAFNGAAQGFLGNLSGFNPATAGQNYTNLLASQTAPANALAAQNLTQQLYNSGALGSTGGANALTALGQQQSNQYVQQQMAGQQLGMQQQSLMGNLASQFGYAGNALNSTNFGMGLNLNNALYGRQYGQAQQGFQNALGLNQAGIQNLGAYSGLTNGMLGNATGLNNALLNQAQVGASMGAERTGAATTAGGINLQGQLAANNTNAAGWNGLISGLTNANWSGLFGQTASQQAASPWGNLAADQAWS